MDASRYCCDQYLSGTNLARHRDFTMQLFGEQNAQSTRLLFTRLGREKLS
jgi:predicted NBD/HSP70 family sugar kinase